MGHDYSTIFTILISCILTVLVFRLFNISSIVGYLIAGFLIGPHFSKLVTNVDQIKLLGEFGVLFLLFSVGLKMPLRRFQVLKKYVFGLGLLQVVITVAIMGVVCICFSFTALQSLLIASAFALSSTAVGLQLLSEKGDLAQQYGRVSFAILLFQDLFVVLILVFLSNVGTDTSILYSLGMSVINFIVVLSIIVLCSKLILRPIFRIISPLNNPEIFTAFSILIILAASFATEGAGISKELGAFIAGFLISGTEYRHQVEADIKPFYGLLLGLFFVAVGMSIDISLMKEHYNTVCSVLFAMIFIKGIILFGLCKVFKLTNSAAFKVSFLLSTGGEFAFIILSPMLENKIVSIQHAQLVYLIIAISMAITPFLSVLAKWMIEKLNLKDTDSKSAIRKLETDDLNNHVIIAGFGRSGKTICHLLTERMIPFVAIDNDMNRVLEGRSKGLPVFYGNATRDSIWKSLSASKCLATVISLSIPKDTVRAGLMVRRKFKNIKTCARINDAIYEEKLQKAGASIIRPEIFEPSLQMTSEILQPYGTSESETRQIIDKFRRLYTIDYSSDDKKIIK